MYRFQLEIISVFYASVSVLNLHLTLFPVNFVTAQIDHFYFFSPGDTTILLFFLTTRFIFSVYFLFRFELF